MSTHYRGDTWCRTWLFRDAAGDPVVLTGASARLHLRAADGTLAASADTSDGMTIDGPSGRVDMRIEATDMLLTPGNYAFDLEVTHADGLVMTVDGNTLTLVEDQTHD